jgi:hypothetical protein
LINLNQTGFIKGTSIAETFIHAIERSDLSQKEPTGNGSQTGFAKAFDTVNWEGLVRVLSTGFPGTVDQLDATDSVFFQISCSGQWKPQTMDNLQTWSMPR